MPNKVKRGHPHARQIICPKGEIIGLMLITLVMDIAAGFDIFDTTVVVYGVDSVT